MKISLNWLKDHIDLPESPQEVSDRLTACGLEVESFEKVTAIPGGLEGLLIGEVLTCQKHPNADKLKVTTVNVGEEVLPIVCGAPNVDAGQKVVVAIPGTTIYPLDGEPFTIGKAKIRGEVSQGMICAEDEIGLGSDHDGIIVLDKEAQVGQAAKDYFKLEEDYLLEIGLTANRGDAASHRGSARDLSAIFDRDLKPLDLDMKTGSSSDWKIKIESEDCPRYSGLLIEGIRVQESPDWLKNRLRTIGLAPINNIVDITNFVMHDLGQPIHAFDADQVKGNTIVVKKSTQGSTFITLDEEERKMDGSELMICNAEEPMAIAGVFGGLKSGIQANTTRVFIESAYFNPVSVRKTAKRHGLSTDASFRYERGTDPEITITAMKRVAKLILELAGGEVKSQILDEYPNVIEPFKVRLEADYMSRLIGIEIPKAQVNTILERLEIRIVKEDNDGWDLTVPAFKSDVTRPADVVEEVLRIYGLDNVPIPEKSMLAYKGPVQPDPRTVRNRTAELLVARGFNEIATNSMTRSSYYPKETVEQAVHLTNPLSAELDIMRPGFLASFLEAVAYNRNRRNTGLKLFEFGKVYRKTENGFDESNRLGLLITGNWNGDTWKSDARAADFYLLKQEVDALIQRLGMKARASKVAYEPWENIEASSAWIRIAPVSNAVLKSFDIDAQVYYAELDWDKMFASIQSKKRLNTLPAPKYPAVRRDLSLVLDEATNYDALEKVIKESNKGLIRDTWVFDVYQGDKIEKGKKVYSLSFILRDDNKTLSDKEIDGLMNKLITNFEKKAGAQIRK